MSVFRNLVVPIDFSDPSEAALSWAVLLARKNQAAIHLVHAYQAQVASLGYEGAALADLAEEIRKSARKRLEEAQKQLDEAGIGVVTSRLEECADPTLAIRDTIERANGDLVVMGTHGYRGLKHAFLGSVTERTIRSVACPVLAVKGPAKDENAGIGKILVPCDFSNYSSSAGALAAKLANQWGASLDLLHAVELPPDCSAYLTGVTDTVEFQVRAAAAKRLDLAAAEIDSSDVPVGRFLQRGVPEDVIADQAEQMQSDLIVMGTRGQSGLAHFLIGSVAERTLRAAPCSVLVVHAGSTEAASTGGESQ